MTDQPADPLTGAQREKLGTPAYDLVPFMELRAAIGDISERGIPTNPSISDLIETVENYLRGRLPDISTAARMVHTAAAILIGEALDAEEFPTRQYVEAFAVVSEVGAKKYAPWNWTKGLKRTQLCGSLWRHATALESGEKTDLVEKGGTGLPHIYHVVWNALAVYHSEYHDILDDRRPEPDRDYGPLRGMPTITEEAKIIPDKFWLPKTAVKPVGRPRLVVKGVKK